MEPEFRPPERSWPQKFSHAFRGIAVGIRGQSSFAVHFTAAVVVIVAASVLQLDPVHWALLLLCITVVLTAETFNSALECMARAVDPRENRHLAQALDIASGAVLVASIGSAVIGTLVFLRPLWLLLVSWAAAK
jgi:diacylglycerol kinase